MKISFLRGRRAAAVVCVLLLLLIAGAFWLSQRRARPLAQVVVESVMGSFRPPPAVTYVLSQDPKFVEAILGKKVIAGSRMEYLKSWPEGRRLNEHGFSGPIEMKLVIASAETVGRDRSEISVSYLFQPMNGKMLKLSAVRGWCGWEIESSEVERVY